MMQNKWSISLICTTIIISLFIFVLGLNNQTNKTPKEAYQVYLDGKLLGIIKDENDFQTYLNNEQESIKDKYKVNKVYAPKGVEIKKVTTYQNKFNTESQIYEKLKNDKPFTIKGYVITIKYNNDSLSEGEKERKPIKINALDKKVFDDAITKTIKAFINADTYDKYMKNIQEEIKDTGSIIENINIDDDITYKEDLISTTDEIFTDVDTLAKYLLYGTLEEQTTYIVQEGDTIEDVATNNKLNVQEFLIANPNFTSANNLLYATQEVVVGLINPIIDVSVIEHKVEKQEKDYITEIQIDENRPLGEEEEIRKGENGLYQVTYKNEYVNGQLSQSLIANSTELKPAVNRIVVRGSKYVPNKADPSYWAWPTNTPYSITTNYAYRWGTFHGAIDISGTGHGSPIYASNNGTVEAIGKGCPSLPYNIDCNGGRGNFVIVNHNYKNYYTIYQHMKDVYVKEGQTVTRGQKIGTMGNSGYVVPKPTASNPTAGTHLHYALYIGSPNKGGRHINPYTLYRKKWK